MTHDSGNAPVLVVGAGPVGLTLAADLRRHGVDVRLIDRAAQPSPLSKALLVWPRTLQILRELGGDGAISRDGMPVDSFRYYSSGRLVARIGFDARTRPVVLPQPDVERLLTEALRSAEGHVDWSHELLGLEQHPTGVTATIATAADMTSEDFSYVVGCDGADSTVRRLLGLDFAGSTYPATFMLVDAYVDGLTDRDSGHYYCSPKGILVIVGLPSGRCRVFTSAPPAFDAAGVDLTETMQRLVDERGPGGLRLHDTEWASTFAVHTRQAARYRAGRAFLAGDAAHIHSPAGGQGLNTGITDAHNLAWKLAFAWHGEGSQALLDSYETERLQVAGAVLRQADLQTRAWMLRKPHEVAIRDAALRIASAGRLFNRDYVPWLAGLRTPYRDGAVMAHRHSRTLNIRKARRGFATGALVSDMTVRLPDRSDVPLGEALSGTRFTLLVLPGPPSAEQATASPSVPGTIIDVLRLDADNVLTALAPGAPARHGDTFVLVRPDQHVGVITTEIGDVHDYLKIHLRGDGRTAYLVAGG